MKTKIDVSYGVIPVFYSGSEWQYLLIHQYSAMKKHTYWVFPKGHPEGIESAAETALRELKEETGITPTKLDPTLFTIEYEFRHEDFLVRKSVTFFVGHVADQSYQLDENEVREARWCTFAEAQALLSHDNTRSLLAEVNQFVVHQGEKGV